MTLGKEMILKHKTGNTCFMMGYGEHSNHVMEERIMFLFYIYVHILQVPDCGLDGQWFPVGATYQAYNSGCFPGLKWGGEQKVDLSRPVTEFNPLAPNDVYIRRTAQLTSRGCILNIYSTNILTEYFKHAAHSPYFSLQYAVYLIMLSFFVPVIFTF